VSYELTGCNSQGCFGSWWEGVTEAASAAAEAAASAAQPSPKQPLVGKHPTSSCFSDVDCGVGGKCIDTGYEASRSDDDARTLWRCEKTEYCNLYTDCGPGMQCINNKCQPKPKLPEYEESRRGYIPGAASLPSSAPLIQGDVATTSGEPTPSTQPQTQPQTTTPDGTQPVVNGAEPGWWEQRTTEEKIAVGIGAAAVVGLVTYSLLS